MADEKKPEKTPTVQELQAKVATLEAELAQGKGGKPAPNDLSKTSGTFTSSRPHYRAGRYYLPGEPITIKDEVPGRTWERVPEAKPSPKGPVAPPQGLRPSDQSIA